MGGIKPRFNRSDARTTGMTTPMPFIFFGHGTPMNALQRNAYTTGSAAIALFHKPRLTGSRRDAPTSSPPVNFARGKFSLAGEHVCSR
jgi:hypothetical protein